MKNLLLFLFAIIPMCGPEHIETIDMGKIPEDVLASIPYHSEDVVTLEHSNGKQIHFKVERNTEEREYQFEHWGDNILFEEDLTTLTPDYPIFSVTFSITNQDTLYYNCNIWMDGTSFNLPLNEYESEYVDSEDSVLLSGSYYYDVFKLTNSYDWSADNPISIDSLYYNFSHGILKITMSNDEYYQIIN